MAQEIIGSMWDNKARNGINSNFTELYDGVNDFAGTVTQDVLDQIYAELAMTWTEPVSTVGDLPTSATTGDVKAVLTETNGFFPVYRFDGTNWVHIQDLDASAMSKLNNIQTQIDALPTTTEVQSIANTAETNAKEYTDVLENSVFGNTSKLVSIVDEGSNNFGYYVKYSDGRMYCSGMEASQSTNIASGSIYRSDGTLIDFPKEFIDTKPIVVTTSVDSVGKWSNNYNPGTKRVTVYQLGTVQTTTTFRTRVSASGWWK